MKLIGKISFFGGRLDTGMSKTELLSLYWAHEQCDKKPHLFFPRSYDLEEGTAWRLNPNSLYCAVRFNPDEKELIRGHHVKVTNPLNGKVCLLELVDWGTNSRLDRLIDASPAAGKLLDVDTGDMVEVECDFMIH